MGTLSNISTTVFRDYLKSLGLTCERINGGHEIWSKEGMRRPVIFQTHIDPISEFIVRNNLRTLGKTRKDIESFMKNSSSIK